ncbi:MAG: exo-beta-1,3-glucanase [Methylococcales bacterium]|nr:MAG: exo-beta-1,3-glucanase [Methylococcales bacterium]
MKNSRLILFLLIVVAVNGLFSWLCNLPQNAGPDVPDGKISSFSYAPFREGQSPLSRKFPRVDQIDEDLHLLAGETYSIRTYSSMDGMEEVPGIARKYGLKVIQGAWIGGTAKNNEAEVKQLIRLANEYPDVITRVIVGNEVLLRGEQKPNQLIHYIRQVKQAIKQPVSYADVWSFYLRYPEVVQELDYYTVHILPYWEDEPLKIDETTARIEENYSKIRDAFPAKPILIGETGWPSAGRQRGAALPSVVNEAKFIRSLVQLANKNGFDYNIVEAFNQPWKSKLEGVVGANWGVYSADRERVFPLTGDVVDNPKWSKRVLFASFLTLLVVSVRLKSLQQLTSLHQLVFLGFTQLLSALLVNQMDNYWYTSYSLIERFHVLFIGGLSLLLGAAILQRTLELLSDKLTQITGLWIRYLVLAFVAVALYKSQSLAMSGRYLSFPYPLTSVPVIGIIGFMLIRFFEKGQDIATALEFNDLFGARVFSVGRTKAISVALAIFGVILIGIETVFVLQSANYEIAYPNFFARMYEVFLVTINYNQLLGWAMLIGALIIRIPLRISAFVLAFMLGEIILGETYAFVILDDFVDNYPSLAQRFRWGFYYTITNTQLLSWVASVLVLAVTLWDYKEQQVHTH